MAHLDIPAGKLAAFGVHGILLGLALASHSQNESVGPITPAVEYMHEASNLCLLFVFVLFTINITRQHRPVMKGGVGNIEEGKAGGADPRTPAAVAIQQYGAMLPHRIGMATFTMVYLILEVCPLGGIVCWPFAPLSFAAAVTHIWLRAEDLSVNRPVKLHFVAHASSAVIYAVRHVYHGNFGGFLVDFVYLTIVYPGLYKAVTRFRSRVRLHGNESAAKLAAVSFVAFWSAVVPVVLYLGADSLGTFLPPPLAVVSCSSSHRHRVLNMWSSSAFLRVRPSVCRRTGQTGKVL